MQINGHHNGLKTALLFGMMWTLILAMGGGLSLLFNSPIFLVISVLVSLGMTFYSYWNSATLALRSMNAYQVGPQDAPELHQIVRELSDRAGKPMPTIWISPTQTPNAFATGRNPENAAVCCTEGILDILNYRELRGVLGHELMHVYNRDILTSSVAAAMGGVITAIAQYTLLFGGRRDQEGGSAIGALLLSLLAPIAATFIQFAISRTREFDADEGGARLTEDPLALASALKKLESGTLQQPLRPTAENEPVAAMMIANPFKGLGIRQMFSTHPPMAERIARLEKMAGY